jgi:hypothetical protein
MDKLDGKEEAMAAVQVAKKELRRKVQNLLKDVPRESVNAQCSDTFLRLSITKNLAMHFFD